MPYRFGPFFPRGLDRLAREQLERERLEQLMQRSGVPLGGVGLPPGGPWEQMFPDRTGISSSGEPLFRTLPDRPHPGAPIDPRDFFRPMPYRPLDPDAPIDPGDAIRLLGLPNPQRFEMTNAHDAATGRTGQGSNPSARPVSSFPFRHDNRKPDGTWDAPDATDGNIKSTSVDPYEPVWPRWKQTPPPHGEGDFVSDQPFFDIDEISQKVEFYPPGKPLTDKNVEGNPASRQRVGDMPGGNLWRRRLLVDRRDFAAAAAPSQLGPSTRGVGSPQGQSAGPPVAVGDLTNFQVVSRNRGGGASNSQAYAHWLGGSGRPLCRVQRRECRKRFEEYHWRVSLR